MFDVIRNDISEVRRNFPYLADDLESRGFRATLTVFNDTCTARFQAYETTGGTLVFVYGSRSLFDRFCRVTVQS